MHHQIERDLHEVARHIPTVVLPTGIEEWPAPWDFGHSQRLISTASRTAGRFLDGLRVSGPGLYRADGAPEASTMSTTSAIPETRETRETPETSAPSDGPGQASTSPVSEVAL